MSNVNELKKRLSELLFYLRTKVSGKTFAEVPELFKDIESVKVKLSKESE